MLILQDTHTTGGTEDGEQVSVYRNGSQVITYQGAGVDEGYDGFFAGHAGGSGKGTWYFDWIAGRNDGEFGPGQWTPVPSSVPAIPGIAFPTAGAVLVTQNPMVQWTGDMHDTCEVHVCGTNSPTASVLWDSGELASTTGSCVTGPITATATCYAFVRLHNAAGWGGWSNGTAFTRLANTFRIIPEPQQLTIKAGTGFSINPQTSIVINTNPDAADTLTANQLRRKVFDTTGYTLPIIEGAPGVPTSDVIAIGDPSRNAAVAAIAATWPEAMGKTTKSEGYLLGISNTSILIRGFDQRGTFYGCQSLILLLEQKAGAPVDALFCYDWPDMPWRGVFIRIKRDCDWDFAKEIITEVVARYKMNYIEPALGNAMVWESHPELWQCNPVDEPVIKQDFADWVSYTKRYFIDVIACGPSWNHSDEWFTMGGNNPDMRENQAATDGTQVEDLCPRNPRAQQIIRDIRDELIAMVQPTYLHVGESEYASIGHSSCPRCAGSTPVALFNEFLANDNNYCITRGVRPIMWGDMLRSDMPAGQNWGTWQCTGTMPKSIIVQDWDYSTKTDFPSIATWNSNMLDSIGAPYGFGAYGYVGKENIYYWGKSAKRHGNWGMIAFNKYWPYYKESVLNDSIQMLNLGCFPFVAEWSWSAERPYWNPEPYSGDAMVRARISPDRPYSFGAARTGNNVLLSWTNPPDASYQGTYVCYRTDRHPTDPMDGTLVCDVPGVPNGHGSFLHTQAPLGAVVYYSSFSHDAVRHFSASIGASEALGPALNVGALSSQPDGTAVSFAQGIVTGVYADSFYVEDDRRTCAIRVNSTASVTEGDVVTINGIVGKTGRERSVDAITVVVNSHSTPGLAPLAMRHSAAGGTDKGYSLGSGTRELYNVGILARLVGKVVSRDPRGDYFLMLDGSLSNGIRVVLAGSKSPITMPAEAYLTVTGVISLDASGAATIRPRGQSDILAIR